MLLTKRVKLKIYKYGEGVKAVYRAVKQNIILI